MAVNWLWKYEKGWYTLVQTHVVNTGEFDLLTGEEKTKTIKHKFKVGLYGGNCLAACIYRYKQLDEESGKMEKYYQFCGFWNDMEHLKRLLGMTKDYKDNVYKSENDYIEKVHLNTFYPEVLQIAKLFTKAGIKVELYYKETK